MFLLNVIKFQAWQHVSTILLEKRQFQTCIYEHNCRHYNMLKIKIFCRTSKIFLDRTGKISLILVLLVRNDANSTPH